MIHKNLHRDATCTEKTTAPEDLNKYSEEFTKRIKLILKIVKEDQSKDMQEGILLKGLKELLDSNTKSILSQTKQMNETWVTMKTALKTEETGETATVPQTTANKITKLTKPAKVPSWTKNMSLETYMN